MTTKVSQEYPILNNVKIKNFYNEIFIARINTLFNQWKSDVDVSNIKNDSFRDSSGKLIGKEKHKERIVKNIVIPVSYLIYSYIYVKYSNFQHKRNIQLENNLNYEMYKSFFSHFNPVVKKVNIFFFEEFQKENKKDPSINLISMDDFKKNKDNIIKFLVYISNEIKKKNNYKDKIDDVETLMNDFKFCINQMNKIITLLNKMNFNRYVFKRGPQPNPEIKYNTTTISSGPELSVFNNIIDTFGNVNNSKFNFNNNSLEISIKDSSGNIIIKTNDNTSFKKIFDDIKNKIIEKNYDIDDDDKKKYNDINKYYLNILEKIKDINLLIIKEKFIKEENINLYDIFKNYIYYKKKFKKYNDEKDKEEALLNYINEIKNYTEDQIEVYDLFFKLMNENKSKQDKNKNKNYNDKIKDHYEHIENINKTIIDNIYKSINKINEINFNNEQDSSGSIPVPYSYPTSTPSSIPIINIELNKIIDETKKKQDNYPNINQLNNFLKLSLISLHINERKEFCYISKLNNKDNNTKLESKSIDKIKFIFENYFRLYKKNLFKDKNDKKNLDKKEKEVDNIIKNISVLKNKSNTNNITTSIDTEIDSLKKEIDKENVSLKQKETDKKNFEKDKNDLKNIYEKLDLPQNFELINDFIIKLNNDTEPSPSRGQADVTGKIYLYDNLGDTSCYLPNYSATPSSGFTFQSDFIKNGLKKEIYTKEEFNINIKNFLKRFVNENKKKNILIKINEEILKILNNQDKLELTRIKNKYIDLIKNKIDKLDIYNLIENLKEKIENKINYTDNEIRNQTLKINELKSNKNKLEIKKSLKENNKSTITNQLNHLNSIKTKINELKNEADITNNSNLISEKNNFIDIFNNLLNSSLLYETKINDINYQKSFNQIDNLYQRNKKLIGIINNIDNIDSSGTISTDKIEKDTLKIINYYSNIKDSFMESITNIVSKNNSIEINPFFENYKKFYQELIDKINNLILRINLGILEINTYNLDIKILEIFKKKIIKNKLELKDKINTKQKNYKKDLNSKKTKKGKITEILVYTDNMFYYFIDLMIIIDYLTFFYK